MGLTGELVRSVFSKSRSVGAHDSNVRSNGKRWSSVRSYLCGDEFNSVLVEDDSASVRTSEATVTQPLAEADLASVGSSEATVTQPLAEYLKDELQIQSEEKEEQKPEEEEQLSSIKHLSKEDAAIVIQSACRGFLARYQDEGIKQMGMGEIVKGNGSPSRESVGTSIEVQTGNSVEVLTVREESVAVQHRVQQRVRNQVYKLKEDWDDSTVSSNISKLRIQNRLEATTRRERALAYAFSQQLRICTKKKSTQSDTAEPNMGWSWLERWMATRLPESSLVEDRTSKWLEPIISDQRSMIFEKNIDVTGGEKESCGSNEVPIGIDTFTVIAPTVKDSYKPAKNRLKATRSVSRRRTLPSYQYSAQLTKVSKKDCSKEAEKDGKPKQVQTQSNRETKYKDASSQTPSVPLTSNSSNEIFE